MPEPEEPILRAGSRDDSGRWMAAVGALFTGLSTLLLSVDWADFLFPVFCVGPPALLLLGLGLDRLGGFGSRSPRFAGRSRANLELAPCLGILLLLAAGYRFATLGWFPPPDGFSSIEETQRATGGVAILDRGARPWEWPYCQYLAAASFAAFGRNIYALRVPVTVLGSLTPLFFYAFARRFLSARAAWIAAAFLAVSRWHVQVSWYNEDVYVPLFPFTVLLWLLFRTSREPRPLLHVALGALTGSMLYTYAAFRPTFLLVLLFLALVVMRRPERRLLMRPYGVWAAVFALFACPLVSLLRGEPDLYFEALHRSFANRDYYSPDPGRFFALRIERAVAVARAFLASDRGAFFPSLNSGEEPLLDPVTASLFVFGLATALRSPTPRRTYLLGAFGFLLVGTTIVVQNLDFRRLSILVPFVFAFVGIAAERVLRAPSRRRASVALFLLLAASAAYNAHFLFFRLSRDPVTRAYHRDVYTVPAFYLHHHYAGEYVFFLTDTVRNFFLPNDYDWLKPPDLAGETLEDPQQFFRPRRVDRKAVLLLAERPLLEGLVPKVERTYEEAACEIRRDPDDSRWDLAVCRIPRESYERGHLATAAREKGPTEPSQPSLRK
ncbi:MAG: hypothetical protein KatS3mg076_2286 [Candidatus Binatia bacterium]|nr:MAG: hypothetical protein KatS3mg076_2286 [Candidatus Binatia bacterium]